MTEPSTGELFAQWLREKEFQADLSSHKWTLAEAEEFKRDTTTPTGDHDQDLANAKFFERVKASSIDPSNARGDFRWPHQMTPKEFAEYAGASGKPVYSQTDFDDIMQAVGANEYETVNTPIATGWREEFKRAFAEGRVMAGPPDPRGHKPAVPFPGETERQRAERINTLGVLMETSVKVRERLEASLSRIRELERKAVDVDTVKSAVLNEASNVAPAVRQTVGVAFDVRGSDEFHALDRLVTEAGGCRAWKFDDV